MTEGRVTKRVLLVEDDEDISALAVLLLRDLGHEVDVVHNGADALAAIARRRPDLILLDMKMPVMDGTSFAREYHRLHAGGPPLVVFTAAEDAGRRASEIGADGHIGKPFEFGEFKATVARFLDG